MKVSTKIIWSFSVAIILIMLVATLFSLNIKIVDEMFFSPAAIFLLFFMAIGYALVFTVEKRIEEMKNPN